MAKGMMLDAKEVVQCGWKGIAIGLLIGFFVGILLVAGVTLGSLMFYGVAKMLSKMPEEYGKGFLDGVVVFELANNSALIGLMLLMLMLGIPGLPIMAILLGGMVIWGLTLGLCFFIDESEFVWGLIGFFYISNIVVLVINFAFILLFVWMLRMLFMILVLLIFVLSIVGGFAVFRSIHDFWLIVIFGLLVFFLCKFDYLLVFVVLAIVLGSIVELMLC